MKYEEKWVKYKKKTIKENSINTANLHPNRKRTKRQNLVKTMEIKSMPEIKWKWMRRWDSINIKMDTNKVYRLLHTKWLAKNKRRTSNEQTKRRTKSSKKKTNENEMEKEKERDRKITHQMMHVLLSIILKIKIELWIMTNVWNETRDEKNKIIEILIVCSVKTVATTTHWHKQHYYTLKTKIIRFLWGPDVTPTESYTIGKIYVLRQYSTEHLLVSSTVQALFQ